MLARREFLLSSTAMVLVFGVRGANAFLPALPVIIGAITGLTALVVAVGDLAGAVADAVEKGKRLKDIVQDARKQSDTRDSINAVLRQVRPVIADGMGSTVGALNKYSQKPEPKKWVNIVDRIIFEIQSLERVAAICRKHAAAFPKEAQEPLGQLAKNFDLAQGIINKIQQLQAIKPPTSSDELERVKGLASELDKLRIESLKLLKELESFTNA